MKKQIVMIREKVLERLKAEAKAQRMIPLARKIGINYVTLWRIVTDRSRGSSHNWDAIFRYYGK